MLQHNRADAQKNSDSSAGHSATLTKCCDRKAALNIIIFLWLLEWCIQFCWWFAGKQTCWLRFCYIVFTGSHAEREIELRLFGMPLYSHSSAFGRLPELLQRSVGELENSMRRGWVEGTLFYVYQADFFFFARVALDLWADFTGKQYKLERHKLKKKTLFKLGHCTLYVLKWDYNHYPGKSACEIGLDLYREITQSSITSVLV